MSSFFSFDTCFHGRQENILIVNVTKLSTKHFDIVDEAFNFFSETYDNTDCFHGHISKLIDNTCNI